MVLCLCCCMLCWRIQPVHPTVFSLQALAVDYARSKLRSELAWTKAKLAFVCNMASGLRAKLAQALTDRAQAGTSCPGERGIGKGG